MAKLPIRTWQDLLVAQAPFATAIVGDAMVQPNGLLYLPELRIDCPTKGCEGPRVFACQSGEVVIFGRTMLSTFQCRNCRKYEKVYATFFLHHELKVIGAKFGELPEFEAPSTPRLDRLLGDARDLFRQGQACEVKGLGIGAFGYYRRVVVNQRDMILDETIKAARAVEAGDDVIERLTAAKAEREFTRSLELAADVLPPALKIAGQNPLKILHSALSEGLHDSPDERCLELAGNIRVVLIELTRRTAELVRGGDEVRAALGALHNRKAKPGPADASR